VTDSIAKIEAQFASNPNISDIMYDKQLVEMVNDNIQKITQWLLIIAGVLTLISMLLINSSLRLLIYSSRFTIKTMQMVGATKRFIRRPFIWHSMRLGIIGSLLAIAAIMGLSFYVDRKFPDLNINPTQNYMPIVFVSLGLLLVGIIITSISTYFATQRFLNLKSDELY
jgi:cell division transport system permease protein